MGLACSKALAYLANLSRAGEITQCEQRMHTAADALIKLWKIETLNCLTLYNHEYCTCISTEAYLRLERIPSEAHARTTTPGNSCLRHVEGQNPSHGFVVFGANDREEPFSKACYKSRIAGSCVSILSSMETRGARTSATCYSVRTWCGRE